MKITVDKNIFWKELQNVTKIITGNIYNVNLQGILISVNSSNLKMTGSNGIVSTKIVLPISEKIKVIEQGRFLIKASLFREIISKQNGDITLEVSSDNQLIINSEGSITKINLYDANEYPLIDFDAFGNSIKINIDIFSNFIKSVSYAAASEYQKVILQGINLQAADGVMEAYATNSFRVATNKMNIDSNKEFTATLLAKHIREFLPSNIKGEVEINVNESKIVLIHPNVISVINLIDGFYPDIKNAIDEEYKFKLQIEKNELIDMIQKATVVGKENEKNISIEIIDGEIIIKSRQEEIGDTLVSSDKFIWSGSNFKINLNSKYLLEALSKSGSKVSLEFNGSKEAFRVTDSDDNNLKHIIFPINNL